MNRSAAREVRADLPLSLRLIGRSSLPGAALILVVALVYLIGVPALSRAAAEAQEEAGEIVTVGGSVAVTLATGWTVEDDDGYQLTLANGGARLLITAAYTPELSLDNEIHQSVVALQEDTSAHWVIGEPAAVETDSGDTGMTVAATSESAATQQWLIQEGSQVSSVLLLSPLESWQSIRAGAEKIALSLTFIDPTAEAGP